METFLEFAKEVLKGVVRAICAHIFKRTFFKQEKTTPRRRKHKGGSQNK